MFVATATFQLTTTFSNATLSMLSPCLPWEPGCRAQCWLGPSGTGFGHAGPPSHGSSLPQGAQASRGADNPSAAADRQVEEPQHTPYEEKEWKRCCQMLQSLKHSKEFISIHALPSWRVHAKVLLVDGVKGYKVSHGPHIQVDQDNVLHRPASAVQLTWSQTTHENKKHRSKWC